MEVGLDSRIGTRLAGYRIEELIGQGGMSVVYRAEDLALGRKVALKLMSPELSDDEGFRERFRLEWRLAASIDHPNVIPIYEAAEADGQLYIAMRYVAGTDLKALLTQEGALEPKRALDLVSQVADGLDAAHERGLVHRDVKPSNVLIALDGKKEHAYLADFGLTKPASTAEEARASIQLSGTTDYVSPEQVADGTAEARSDIYSLGALIYESLTGEVPYPRERKLQVLFAHVNDPPPKPTDVRPELPEAVDEVIAKAMAKEPEDRYSNGAELAEAAAAAFPEPGRPPWQIAALVGVLALVIAAAVAIPAVLLTGGSDEARPQGTTEITTDAVQRIDQETGELVATIELEGSADDVSAGGAGIWVLNKSERTLSRIDPQSDEIAESVRLDVAEDQDPGKIAVEDESILVTFFGRLLADSASVWAFDPSSRGFEEVASGFEATDLVGAPVDEERVWVLIETFGPSPRPIPTLLEVDRETNEVATTIELVMGSTLPQTIAVGAGFVWIPSPQDNELIRLDPTTKDAVSIPVDRQPVAAAFAGGDIWVVSARDGTLSRINPETFNIETIDVGGAPTDVAASEEGVWVTVRP